ncbi:MAG: hypothetical protein ACP5O1_01310 [Phycisphaerae bacterium]
MMNRGGTNIPHVAAPAAVLILCLLLAGCTSAPPARNGEVRLAHGTVKVLSINQYLKTAVVHYRGATRNAWWNRYSILYFGGRATRRLLAKPGQRVKFDGLLADGDIYFGRAWRGSPPPPVVYPPGRIVYPNGKNAKKKIKVEKPASSPAPASVPALGQYLQEHLGS